MGFKPYKRLKRSAAGDYIVLNNIQPLQQRLQVTRFYYIRNFFEIRPCFDHTRVNTVHILAPASFFKARVRAEGVAFEYSYFHEDLKGVKIWE